MSARRYTQFFNTLHTKPVLLDCNFTVDVANVNGYGLSGLVGPGVQGVYMNSSASFVGSTHTNTVVDSISSTANLVVGMRVQGSGIPVGTRIASITSATAIVLSAAATTTVGGGTITYQGAGSPNPAAGYAIVQLADNFKRYYGGFGEIASPQSGSSILVASAGVVANLTYVITIVGTTTAAQWQSIGLPVGITPAVGVPFVAIKTGTATGTGAVQIPKAAGSGVAFVEVIGAPNTTIMSAQATVAGISSGSYVMLRFMGGVFTGSALAVHNHNFTVIGGQAGSTTNNIANYAGPLIGKEQATDATYVGSASATNGGVVAGSAGTPAGTVSYAAVAPSDGSLVHLALYLSDSSILNKGE